MTEEQLVNQSSQKAHSPAPTQEHSAAKLVVKFPKDVFASAGQTNCSVFGLWCPCFRASSLQHDQFSEFGLDLTVISLLWALGYGFQDEHGLI